MEPIFAVVPQNRSAAELVFKAPSLLSAAIDVIEPGIDARGHAAFNAGAPVGEARHEQVVPIDDKRCKQRKMGEAAGIVKEKIGARALKGAAEDAQVCPVIINTHAGADLGLAALVQKISSGQTGRNHVAVDESIAVPAQAGVNDQALHRRPAVLHVGAGLDAVQFGSRSIVEEDLAND